MGMNATESIQTNNAPLRQVPQINVRAKLDGSRLRPLEAAQRFWFADAPAGVGLETVMQPHYWAHHARVIQPDDMIRARCEDGSWAADLWVMFVDPGEVRVAVYHYVELDAPTDVSSKSDLYQIKWQGPGAQFAVVNTATGATIKNRLYPKSEALKYLQNHLKQVAKS